MASNTSGTSGPINPIFLKIGIMLNFILFSVDSGLAFDLVFHDTANSILFAMAAFGLLLVLFPQESFKLAYLEKQSAAPAPDDVLDPEAIEDELHAPKSNEVEDDEPAPETDAEADNPAPIDGTP
ncbi:hypothetical protein ABUW04_00025 [Streptacidiphilus sp. N1-10]|uniref:Uncharacterized protein n=1 Tax=Streptacidiphilus jeojiensis TaxID=3229225 RepID=A0ABV6XFC9_9ACTN